MNNELKNKVMNLVIDRLVITGIDLTPRQQRQLSKALQTSLRERFESEGIPPNMSSLSSATGLPVKGIQLTGNKIEPASLGRQIANTIFEGLKK